MDYFYLTSILILAFAVFVSHIRIGVLQEEVERLRNAIQPPFIGKRSYEWDVIDG